MRKQPGPLNCIADAPTPHMQLATRNRFAQNPNSALISEVHRIHQLQQRRLSAPAFADDSGGLPFGKRKIHIIEHPSRIEAFEDAGKLDSGSRHLTTHDPHH